MSGEKRERSDQKIQLIPFVKKISSWFFNPEWNVARSWFLLFVLTILGIALLGIFLPLTPVGAILFIKLFGAFALGASLTTGILSFSRDYERVRNGQSEFSIFTYVKEVLPAWLGKSNRNIIQFAFGVSLFFLVSFVVSIHLFPIIATTLLTILPPIQPLFDILSAMITFFQAGFNVSMIFSPLAVSVFLGIAVLTSYDLLCRVIKAIFPIEGEGKGNSATATFSIDDGKMSEANEEEVPLVKKDKKKPENKAEFEEVISTTGKNPNVDGSTILAPVVAPTGTPAPANQ